MKRLKKAMIVQLVCIIVCLLTAGVIQLVKQDKMNKYSAPIEVRYVAEKIIQNSEGRVYEYEYELETKEGNTIFWHSRKKQKLSKKFKIAHQKEEGSNSIVHYETVEQKEEQYDFWKTFFIGLAMANSVSEIFALIAYQFMKRRKKQEKQKVLEKEKLYKEISEVRAFIKKNYPEFTEISDSLKKISKMISTLDDFYKGQKDEAIYNNGLRPKIKKIMDGYLKNMEIDRQFENQKLIKKELHQELQNTLQDFLVHVELQIASLTDENDASIYQKLDEIRAESKLSDETIKILAKKYDKSK